MRRHHYIKNTNTAAMTLSSLPGKDPNFLGSMLFSRFVSGTRIVDSKTTKTICGLNFQCYGSHIDTYPIPYLCCSCTIGITKNEIDVFLERLEKVFAAYKKEIGKTITNNSNNNNNNNNDNHDNNNTNKNESHKENERKDSAKPASDNNNNNNNNNNSKRNNEINPTSTPTPAPSNNESKQNGINAPLVNTECSPISPSPSPPASSSLSSNTTAPEASTQKAKKKKNKKKKKKLDPTIIVNNDNNNNSNGTSNESRVTVQDDNSMKSVEGLRVKAVANNKPATSSTSMLVDSVAELSKQLSNMVSVVSTAADQAIKTAPVANSNTNAYHPPLRTTVQRSKESESNIV